VVVSVVGGGENFSDGEISKTTTIGPLQFSYYTVLLFQPCVILADIYGIQRPPTPDRKHRRPLTLTNKRMRTNEQNEQIYGPS